MHRTYCAKRHFGFGLKCPNCINYYSWQKLMFSYQMKLISIHPVGPASPFYLPLLHTHQLVSIPRDGGLHEARRKMGL